MKKTTFKILAVSLFFSLSFWTIDAFLGYFIFNKGIFLNLLILKIPQHGLYIRLVIVGLFLVFGLILSQVFSKQKQIEEEFQKSEERIREVFKHSQDALYKRNLKTGKYEYMSPAIAQLSGYTVNEVMNMSVGEIEALIHPEDIKKINDLQKIINETSSDQEIIAKLEYRIKHKNGTYRCISDHFKLIRDTEGHPAFTVASIRDVTEQKETEKKLQESEKIAEALISAPSDSVFLIDKEGIILDLNETAAQSIGKSIDELRGQYIYGLFSPEVSKRRKKWLKEILQDKNPIRVEDERDGKWFDTICYPILDQAGDISSLAIFSHNITQRKKVEQDLRLQGEIASNLSEGIFLCRMSDGTIIYANPRFEKIFGYLPGEMSGRHVSILNSQTEKTAEEVADSIRKSIEKTGSWKGEIQNIKKDGTPFWCYASVSLFDHPEYGEIAISIHSDISERKKAEEKLNQYQQIVSSSTDMMALLNTQFEYIAANKAYLEALDLSYEKLVGQSVSDIFGEEFFKKVIKPYAEQCLSGKKINYQDWFDFPVHGKMYMDATYSPYIGEDKEVKGFVVNERDITDRKKVEDELINSKFWLEESQRVSKVGSYLVDIPKDEWTSSKTLNNIFGITSSYKRI